MRLQFIKYQRKQWSKPQGLARFEQVVELIGLLGVRQQEADGTVVLEIGQPSQWLSLGTLGLVWPEFPVAHKKPEIYCVVLFFPEVANTPRWNMLKGCFGLRLPICDLL